ncbi:MAG: hypothetical protein U0939_23470 [Pirellulales bacterium]
MDSKLEQRLHRLERDHRRLKQLIVSAGVIVATAALMGARSYCSSYSTIQAQSFVLVDNSGARRAELAMEAGQPHLKMYAEDGNSAVIQMAITPQRNTRLLMLGKGGLGVMGIGVTPDQQNLELGGSARIRLDHSTRGGPRLQLGYTDQAQIEIGKLNFDWVFRTFNTSGVATELHRVPVQ